MAMESGSTVISHESIYRFIYGQIARKKDYSWRHYLPRAKSKRGWRGHKGGSPASFMAKRRPITERPQSAADRRTPGHWEADLMLFRALWTCRAYHARTPLPHPHSPKAPWQGIQTHRCRHVPSVGSVSPPEWRRTVTFDNGTEFALHYQLHDLGIETFFCDTYSPWQKGGGRERHRSAAADPAPQNGLGSVASKTVYANDSGLQ